MPPGFGGCAIFDAHQTAVTRCAPPCGRLDWRRALTDVRGLDLGYTPESEEGDE